MSRPLALSHSRLSTYLQCPRKFNLQYNLKAFPDDSNNPNFIYGNERHDEMDKYVKWRNRQLISKDQSDPKPFLSPESENTTKIVSALYDKGFKLFSEKKFAITKQFTETAWFDLDVYYRCIVDALAIKGSTAIALDYKTGKVYDYDGYGGQLHLTALFIFAIHPTIQHVSAAYLYMNHQQSIQISLSRDTDYEKLKEHFNKQYRVVLADTKFDYCKNRYCFFCQATHDQCPVK